MERVGDAGEADHQLEATRDVTADGTLEPLELDAVGGIERRHVERLHRRRRLVVRERARRPELRLRLGRAYVGPASVRKREAGDHHPVRDVPRRVRHRNAVRERADAGACGGMVEKRPATEVGRVDERLAEARVVARVEVLEGEDAVLAGLLAGQERRPGRGRYGRTRRAEPRAHAARHETAERGHLARRDQGVDHLEGRPVDAEDERPVSHGALGVLVGLTSGRATMRETCRMRGAPAARGILHGRATARERHGWGRPGGKTLQPRSQTEYRACAGTSISARPPSTGSAAASGVSSRRTGTTSDTGNPSATRASTGASVGFRRRRIIPGPSAAGLSAVTRISHGDTSSSGRSGATSGASPAATARSPSSASRAARGSSPEKSDRAASIVSRHCAPGAGISGPAGRGRLVRSIRASQPTARTRVTAMTPSAVTSASGSPGAATVRPLAETNPWWGKVGGAGCTQRLASRRAVWRQATSNVVAARNDVAGAPVGHSSP